MNSNQVLIYRENKSIQDCERILEWVTEQVPSFALGQTLWLTIAVHPTWVGDKPKTMELAEFIITDVVHALLRTYTEEISTFYKVEVTVKQVGDE